MGGQTVPPRSDAVQVAVLLDSPEIDQLVAELAATRWTGRPGYPIRTMVGMGAPLGREHPLGRFVLRLQAAPARVRCDRATVGVDGGDRQGQRVQLRHPAAGSGHRAQVPARGRRAGQGLRPHLHLRGVRAIYAGFERRDCHPVIPLRQTPPSRPAGTSRRLASTASGPSPGPTPSGRRPSGAARPASVPRPARGSPPVGCTPSSRAARPGGSSSTGCVAQSSGRMAGSSTSGACCPCGSGESSGCGCTLT